MTLSTRIHTAPDAKPTRTAYVLHGILGSKRNWGTMARRMAQRWPTWRFIAVDLRNHGDSSGLPGPHTLTACARDLDELAKHEGRPQAVIGHSFGGKVALRYAELFAPGLEQVWVLDSALSQSPATAKHDVTLVIETLCTVPQPLASRNELVQLMNGRGFSDALAGWMTTNLRRGPDGYRWTFDLLAIEQMMADYFEQDLWPLIEDPPCTIHLLRAERSGRLDPMQEAKLHHLTHRVMLHTLPDSGHWVHVDNPDGLLQIMDSGFAILE